MPQEIIGSSALSEGSDPAGTLGFGLEFRQGMALLTLSDLWLADLLHVRRLELELPGVSFPFDLQGGAAQFHHRRCQLRSLILELPADRLALWLEQALGESETGIRNARVELRDDQGLLSGHFHLGERQAPFTARFALMPGDELLVRLGFFDLRLYRWMPAPPVALIAQLARACGVWARGAGAAWLEFDPLRDLLKRVLPMHGWKLPDFDGVRMLPPSLRHGRLRLVAGKRPEELGEWLDGFSAEPSRAFLAFAEGTKSFAEAELALRAGKLDQAQTLYLGKAEVEPAHPLALRRMLEIGLANPDRSSMLEDRIKDVLARDAGDMAALLARALLREQRGELNAGESFLRVAELTDKAGEHVDAILAYSRAADLLAEHDLAKAISASERICQLDSQDRAPLRRLAELYEQAHRFYPALRSWLRLAHREEKDSAIAHCHARMARIHLERFEDLEKARKHLDAALTREPRCYEALVLQAEVQRRRQKPARAAEALARALEVLDAGTEPSPHGQAINLRLSLARLWEEDLDDPVMALLHYERVLDEQPDHQLALSKVGQLAAEQKQPDKAAEASIRLLDLEATGVVLPESVLLDVCLRLGQLYLDRPGGEGEARRFLDRVVALEPENLRAWDALEKIDRRLGDSVHLVEVLENRAVLIDDVAQAVDLLLEAGRLADEDLEDGWRAEKLYRQVLQRDAGNGVAQQGLEKMLEAGQRWGELEKLWVAGIDASVEEKEAARRWARVAGIRLEHLDDLQGGLLALRSAFALDVGHGDYGLRLLGLYRQHGRLEPLANLIPAVADAIDDPAQEVELWIERARILVEQLGMSAEAIESYRRALDLDEGQLEARRALADLFVEAERWSEAREAIAEVIRFAGEGGLSGPGMVVLHRRWAQAELALGDREAAIEQLRHVLAIDEADEDTALQLSGLLRDAERWQDLAALYAQRAELATFEEAARLHTAAASIWWEKLKQLEPAASQYKAAVEAAPDSDAAPARLASLQRVYAGLGDWQQVVDVIEQRIALADARQVPGLTMAMAAILRGRLDRQAEAVDCWRRALEADPEHLDALVALASHDEATGEFDEALALGQKALAVDQLNRTRAGSTEELWEDQAWEQSATGGGADLDHIPVLSIERRAALALATARAAWVLERWDEAIELYQAHMETFANRGYADVEPEAVERLEMLFRKQRRYEDLALLLQRWLKSELLPERHPGLQRALALLMFEHLDDPEAAVDLLTEHVREFPQDQAAVRDLIEMLDKSKRYEQLARLLEDQWDMAPEPTERLARIEKLARTFREHIHDNQAAIEYMSKLYELGGPRAAEELLALYDEEDRLAELASLLRAEAEKSQNESQAATLWRRLGVLAQDELQDPALAVEAFERLYAIAASPANLESLLEALRGSDQVGKIESVLSMAAAESEEPEERRALLIEHADICLSRMDLERDGLASLREALLIRPDEALARRAQALYERQEDFAGVADMQEVLVDLAEEQATAARRIHRLGLLFAERLDAPDRALAAFAQAAELDDAWLEPMRESARLLSRTGRFEELVEVQVRIAKRTERKQERAKLYQQAAHLCLEDLEDEPRGFELLRLAAEATPEQAVVWFELADLLESAGRAGEAADVLDKVAGGDPEQMEGLGSQAALCRRIAALREASGDEAGAIAAYERTLMLEPSDERSAARLESLYRELGRYEDLAQMLTALARRATGDTAVQNWLAVARTWIEAGEAEQAESAVEQALAVDSGHEEARSLMAGLLATRRAWPRFLDLISSMSDALLEREDLTRHVLNCWEAVDEETETALLAAQAVLRLDPIHLDALRLAARVMEAAGQADEAEVFWRRLDEQAERLQDDERYTLDLHLANLDFARGRTDSAEQRLKRCVEVQPDDPGPRAFLHKLYSGGRRFEDRVRLLLDEAQRVDSEHLRYEKLRAAAQLMELELGDPARAAGLFEDVVVQNPEHIEAWRKLAELRRLTNEPAAQVVALMHLAALVSGEEREKVLRRAARLCSDSLLDESQARELWMRLLAGDPGDEEALARLIGLARAREDWGFLRQLLEQKLERLEDRVERASTLRELADLHGEKLAQADRAIAVLQELSNLVPSDQLALERLESLLLEGGRMSEAAEILAKRVELAGSELERAPLLLRLADLQWNALEDRAAAVASLRQAAQWAPEDSAPLSRLREIAEETGNDELMAETLDAMAGRSQSREQEAKLRRALGLLRWSAGRIEPARKAFERLLSLYPDDAVAHRFMARMLQEQDDVAALRHLKWLLAHEEFLNPGDRLECLRAVRRFSEDSGPAERIEVLQRILLLDPMDAQAKQQLADLYRQTERRRELADLLVSGEERGQEIPVSAWMERAGLLEQSGDLAAAATALSRAFQEPGSHRRQVAEHLAQLQRGKLNDPEAALSSLELALGEAEEDAGLLGALVDLAEELGRIDEAIIWLERLRDAAEPKKRAGLSMRLAALSLRLDERGLARKALTDAIEVEPGMRAAYEELDALFVEDEDTDPQEHARSLLRWAGSSAAGGRKAELLARAGDLLLQAQDEEAGLDAFLASIKVVPEQVEVLRKMLPLLRSRGREDDLRQSCALLGGLSQEPLERLACALEEARLCRDPERLRSLYELCLELDGENRIALRALGELRAEEQDFESAAALYARLDELDDEPKIVRRRAELAIALGDDEQLVQLCHRILEHTPEDLKVRQMLVLKLDVLGRWEEAIESLDAYSLWAGEDRAGLLDRLEGKMAHPRVRAHLLGLKGELDEGAQPGLWIERADLLVRAEQWPEAASSLQRALAFDGEHRLETARRLAELRDKRLDDQEGAAAALEVALACKPQDDALKEALVDLYFGTGQTDKAGPLLESLALVKTGVEGARWAIRLGELRLAQEDRLNARRAFESALEMDPAAAGAYEHLEWLLADEEDRKLVGEFYLRWAAGPGEQDKKATLLLTAARQFERAGSAEKAIAALRAALELEPERDALYEHLALLLGQEQRWRELLDVLQVQVDGAGSDERRVTLLFEMAAIAQHQMADLDLAASYYQACLEWQKDQAGALEELAEIRYQQGDDEAVDSLYARLGDRVSRGRRFLVAFRRAEGAVRREAWEDARAFCLASMETNPSFLDARRLLLDVLDRLAQPEESIRHCQELLDILPESGFEEEELELWRRMAESQRSLLRFDEAARSYEKILAVAPRDAAALRALAEHFTNGMDWSKATEFARRSLDVQPDSPDKARAFESLGDLLRLQSEDAGQVEAAYRQALALRPSLFSASWKLWQILRSKGDWPALRELGPDLLGAGLSQEHEAEVRRVLGRAVLMTGGEGSEALAHFEAALHSGKADRSFVEETAELARMLERWELYTTLTGQLLDQRLEEGLDAEVAMEGYLGLAQVFQEELQDVERAAACVRRALELYPRDQELLRRLGTLYASNFETYREAIEVFRELQGMDPVDPDVLRYLARLEAARGEMDRSACYYTGLRFLQPMDPEAKRLLEHMGPCRQPVRPLSRSEWDRVVLHPKADCLLQRIFSALAPYLERLFPANLERFQLAGEASVEVAQLAERARRLVSGRPFDFLLAEENVYQSWLESGLRPSIVLSRSVLERGSDSEQGFFVARQVIRVAMGGVLTDKFSLADLEQLMGILAKMVQADHEPSVPLPATAEQYMAAIERVVPAEDLELVVPLLRRYALEPRAHDLKSWLIGVQRTADRAALLCCGDLGAALAVMTRFSEAAGGRDLAFIPDRASLVTRDQDMLALLRFAYTEPYFQLRRELDLLVR